MASLIEKTMQRLHEPIYASRLAALGELVARRLRPGDALLDVGCGGGRLASAIVGHPHCPERVTATGLERFARGGEAIQVISYQGGRFPFPDNSFDAVMVADVLHHDSQPSDLLKECVRVSRRTVVIKDHAREGFLAQRRISLMDWAANRPYGVECLYRYNSLAQWNQMIKDCGLVTVEVFNPMRIYPKPWEWVFGGRLQFMAFTQKATVKLN